MLQDVRKKEGELQLTLDHFIRRPRSPYLKGISKERLVAKILKLCVWQVKMSRGSRGPYDLFATRGAIRPLRWCVQVKLTSYQSLKKYRRSVPLSEVIAGSEERRLRNVAGRMKALPVVAFVMR